MAGLPPALHSPHLYIWVKQGTVRVKCLAQEHNAEPWPLGLHLNAEHSDRGQVQNPLLKGWRMVTTSLCETVRSAFFSARLRLFEVFGLRDQDLDPKTALQKIRDCETFRTAQKTRQ